MKLKVEDISEAIERVFESYSSCEDEEVLIQPMLENVVKSGVVFTRDPNSYAEYYVINYQEGKDTTAVTSGKSDNLKAFVSYKRITHTILDEDMRVLIDSVKLIEKCLINDALDIEFAIDASHKVYIFQCRPIARSIKNCYNYVNISPALERIYKKIQKLSKPHPFLLGHSAVFGVMPDWNPAEMLGVRPQKLAISLYKELITDSIWARQRKNYGYRDLTMHPLMISFCGVPYIDSRISFNSFIPAKLNKRIAEKLVNYYIDVLSKYPKYHDKVEFEIVFSCYCLGLHPKLMRLLDYGFEKNEIYNIEFSLLEVTNRIINPQNGLYKDDFERIKILDINYERIINSDLSLVEKIYWLIEECKEYGTLPFAGIARASFIAIQFLRSFVDIGIITIDEYNKYFNSLNTVNRQLYNDIQRLYIGNIGREEFLYKYGHIRPGTYDITSKRYDESFDEYFLGGIDVKMTDKPGSMSDGKGEDFIQADEYMFSSMQMEAIQTELDKSGLILSSLELMSFIKESIEGRERLKFVFTKSVSKVLQLVEQLGDRFGISREDMAFVDISIIKQLYSDLFAGSTEKLIRDSIKNNKEQYEYATQIKLPSVILLPEDVYSFYLLDEEPNYVTQKKAIGRVRALVNNQQTETFNDIEGAIVFIQSADPGYDFIFSRGIAGLVTRFGGANSHMAIRCAELGIPAVIGVGENRYKEWSQWHQVEVDCQKKQVIRVE